MVRITGDVLTMKFQLLKRGTLTSTSLILLLAFATFTPFAAGQVHIYIIDITSETDQQTYYLRQPLTVEGTFTNDSQPLSDALVSMEILDAGNEPFAFRTIPIGNPQEAWEVSVTEASMKALNGTTITAARINSMVQVNVNVKNNLGNSLSAIIAYTIYDNTLIPISSSWWQVSLGPRGTAYGTGWVYIPEWAKPGKAIICSNVYTALPIEGGMPYAPERLDYFDIVLNDQDEPPYSVAPDSYQTQPGEYQIFLRMSPDRYAQPGNYSVYVVGRITPAYRPTTVTTFMMEAYASPPQASFTYYPPKLLANMTTTLDASSSSAEGYNDTITRYEWTIDDPYNPEHIIETGNYTNPPSPLANHTFQYPGTFVVGLNVTDNEGLWSTTTKPIAVLHEFGPTANFTWPPSMPYANKTSTPFDASSSTTGWSAQARQYSPITTYTWDFSDGTGNVTTPAPLVNHTFTQIGNLTVTLTIMDAVGRVSFISKIVEVRNYTFPWDVYGDLYVGTDDIFGVAVHFGLLQGDPGYDPIFDITGDGYVGVDDILEVAMHFGEEAP